MIPKIIHYCWFGKNPKSPLALKCIESWKHFCPDYQFIEWNESNFDLSLCSYVEEAYHKGKWAFVSDYVRFWALYHYGGVYFDVDVEMIKPIDDLLMEKSFMGIEDSIIPDKVTKAIYYNVAPGLGMGAEKNFSFYKEVLDYYDTQHFLDEKGNVNQETIVIRVTELLQKYGYKGRNELERINDITLFPTEFFCPLNQDTFELQITDKTYTIHWYAESWHSDTEKRILVIERAFNKRGVIFHEIGRIASFPLRVKAKIEHLGYLGTLDFIFLKIKSMLKKEK